MRTSTVSAPAPKTQGGLTQVSSQPTDAYKWGEFGLSSGMELSDEQVNKLLRANLIGGQHGFSNYKDVGAANADYDLMGQDQAEWNKTYGSDPANAGLNQEGIRKPGSTNVALKGGRGDEVAFAQLYRDPEKKWRIGELGGHTSVNDMLQNRVYAADDMDVIGGLIPSLLVAAGTSGLGIGSALGNTLGLSGTIGTGVGTGMVTGGFSSAMRGDNILGGIVKGGALGGVGGAVSNYINPRIATDIGPVQPNVIQSTLGFDAAKALAAAGSAGARTILSGGKLSPEQLALAGLDAYSGLPVSTVYNAANRPDAPPRPTQTSTDEPQGGLRQFSAFRTPAQTEPEKFAAALGGNRRGMIV